MQTITLKPDEGVEIFIEGCGHAYTIQTWDEDEGGVSVAIISEVSGDYIESDSFTREA